MTDQENILIEALKSNAEWINNVLFVGLTLCLIMFILKILGRGEEFEVLRIRIPTKYFWVVIAIMTIAHLYCTILFDRSGLELFNNYSYTVRINAFNQLKLNGPLFFRGTMLRQNVVELDMFDPTTWIARLAVILMFLSLVRWKNVKWQTRIFSLLIAIVLSVVNWGVGANWAVAASKLSLCNRGDSTIVTVKDLIKLDCVKKQQSDMVWLTGGSFMMGSDYNYADSNEKPVHKVSLNGFYISKYEVTIVEFKQFVEETRYLTEAEKANYSYVLENAQWQRKFGENWRMGNKGDILPANEMNRPVTNVSWNDAVAFCKWLCKKTGRTFRLPTESEWEYAARGGKKSGGYLYSGSDTPTEVGWIQGNSGDTTHAVGTMVKPNEQGLYDMTGNVWEWCSDWYGPYEAKPEVNPKGPSKSTALSRVIRGGAWPDGAQICSLTYRFGGSKPTYRDSNIGFRVVCEQ